DHLGSDHILGDLDANRAEIAARAHDQHGLAAFKLRDVDEQVPGGRYVAHDHGGVVEVELIGEFDRGAGRTATISAKPPGRLMPIMPVGPAYSSASSRQISSGMTPAAATRIPARQRVTPGPSASTTPAQSTPGMSGSTGPRARSLPTRKLTSSTRLTVAA